MLSDEQNGTVVFKAVNLLHVMMTSSADPESVQRATHSLEKTVEDEDGIKKDSIHTLTSFLSASLAIAMHYLIERQNQPELGSVNNLRPQNSVVVHAITDDIGVQANKTSGTRSENVGSVDSEPDDDSEEDGAQDGEEASEIRDNSKQKRSTARQVDFECGKCGKSFTMRRLRLHEPTHCENQEARRKHKCDECGRAFVRADQLRYHMRCHLPDDHYLRRETYRKNQGNFTCEICGKCFSSNYWLKAHVITHSTDKEEQAARRKHKCGECGKSFLSSGNLKDHENSHLQDDDPRKKSYECGVCGKKCSSISSRNIHRRTHLDDNIPEEAEQKRPYKCEECGKAYTGSSNLRDHMLLMHADVGSAKPVFSCEICGKTYITSAALRSHRSAKHTAGKDDKVTCNICGKTLSRWYALNIHQETHNKAVGNRLKAKFECGTCGKGFSGNSALSGHEKTHLDDADPAQAALKRPFKCELCEKAFGTRPRLRAHMSSHTGIYAFTCELCGLGMANKTVFNKHMINHEKGTVKKLHRPNKQCHLCPRKFVKKGQLVVHLKRHEDGTVDSSDDDDENSESPVDPCSVCGKKFKNAELLRIHQQSHPEGEERKFKCNKCEMRFISAAHLKMHIEAVHTASEDKQRKFKCDQCEKRFTGNQYLLFHKRHAHPKSLVPELTGCSSKDKQVNAAEKRSLDLSSNEDSHLLRG